MPENRLEGVKGRGVSGECGGWGKSPRFGPSVFLACGNASGCSSRMCHQVVTGRAGRRIDRGAHTSRPCIGASLRMKRQALTQNDPGEVASGDDIDGQAGYEGGRVLDGTLCVLVRPCADMSARTGGCARMEKSCSKRRKGNVLSLNPKASIFLLHCV